MQLKYSSGNLNGLKGKLNSILPVDSWKEINANTHQAKHENGAVVNYYSTTGTIQVQSRTESVKKHLEEVISKLLNDEEISPSEKISVEKKDYFIVNTDNNSAFLSADFPNTEIVIALVGAVGVEYKSVIGFLSDRLINYYGYRVDEVKVSEEVIKKLPFYKEHQPTNQFDRITHMIEQGNAARQITKNNAILAMGVADRIRLLRGTGIPGRKAYIINTLKHPEEVKYLREIYGKGFFLVGVFADQQDRHKHLTDELTISDADATELIERDKDEKVGHGQHTSDTFDLADFFVYIDLNSKKLKSGIHRFLNIVFADTTVTPTFEEYAMFMAFASSLRSADLSRQVGAVIASADEIIATGTNDNPKFGGGIYSPNFDESKNEICDVDQGRDYTKGYDSNAVEKQAIIDDIIDKLPQEIDGAVVREILKNSRIKDLTEYGRVVHAEMEALMTCARNHISARGSTIYCTTFPCHNCAKHIVAAGVERVVYIEPYPKSKALEFHSDAIMLGFAPKNKQLKYVYFEPFTGLGPRKFFDLFSMNLGSGRSIKRKDSNGKLIIESSKKSRVKLPLIPLSYLEREKRASDKFGKVLKS